MYKDEITPILHNLFREEKGMLPNAFYEASTLPLIQIPDKDSTKRENS